MGWYQRRVHGDSSLESQVELTEEEEFIIMPDQAVANHSRSASYAKKVLYKRKRWTTSGERKPLRKLVKLAEPSDSTQSNKNDDDLRPPVPVNLTEPPRSLRTESHQAPF